MWNHLPINGDQYRERKTSTEWHFFDPMASVMRRSWSWWTLTGRDEQFREGLYVDPWKLGDGWEHVGLLDAESAVPWPWPRAA